MIGLVMRTVVGETLGPLGMIIAPIIAILAICGCAMLCRCRMRDCGCCKRLLRATGTDPFDDFEVMLLVHKATFTASSKSSVYVRIRAGDHEVCTDPSSNGIFQQGLSVFVEQGTQVLKLELLNTSDSVLAELQLNVMKDILGMDSKDGEPLRVDEKVYIMKQKCKTVLNPRVVLTFSPDGPGDEEQALLANINASSEVQFALQKELQKTQAAIQKEGGRGKDGKGKDAAEKPQEQLSELALLAKGCFGNLHMFGSLGAKSQVYVGVLAPPRRKKFALHIWDTEKDYRDDKPSKQEIELLRVSSVSPDPGRPDIFIVSYVDKDKRSHKAMFQRIDRGRDVWVELLQILVTKVHEDHKDKKEQRPKRR